MLTEEFTPAIVPEIRQSNKNNQVDILICAMPALYIDRAPGAPAALQGAAEELGYKAQSIDLSINFFINQCNKNIELHEQLSSIFKPNFLIEPGASEACTQWLNDSILLIKEINPRIIGLSVFSIWQHRSTRLLAIEIRKHLPNVKIIVGGYGLHSSANTLSIDFNVKKLDQLLPFHQYLKKYNLVDYVVTDNPIENFANILDTELGRPNIDVVENWQILDDNVNYQTPIPNFDNYQLENYIWNDGLSLPVTGSLGCVRNCTFCDVRSVFGKFKFRTGKDIAREIIQHHQKYGVRNFEFTDSLVNGSLKAFREWLEIVATYNDNLPLSEKIRWTGQYICRPPTQMPNDLYALMSRAGANNLIIGVESGSNYILKSMRKKMTVEDVFYELDQFEKYNIKATLLIISGYYNETWERYLETLRFIVKIQPFVTKGIITKLAVGLPLFIQEGTPLKDEAEHLGLILDNHDVFNWMSKLNETGDFTNRALRRFITQILLDRLKIPMSAAMISFMHELLGLLKKRENQLQQQLDKQLCPQT